MLAILKHLDPVLWEKEVISTEEMGRLTKVAASRHRSDPVARPRHGEEKMQNSRQKDRRTG